MEAQKFRLEEWNVEKIIKFQQDGKLSLPKFQRGLSWNNQRKEELIKTMRDGNPIGTILLNDQRNVESTFQIIDGLQRISTIIDYKTNFKNYFNESFVPKDIVIKIVENYWDINRFPLNKDSLAFTNNIIQLTDIIVDTYKKEYGNSVVKFNRVLIENLPDDYNVNSWRSEFEDYAEKIYLEIKENEELKNFDIPIIVYTGPEFELPEIFEKLNTGGVVLSKYDIFAARWVSHDIGLINDKLVTLLQNKYEAISEGNEGYDINYDSEEGLNEGVNLYEFCYSLGEYISNNSKPIETKNTLLFREKKNIGFEILNLILTNKITATEYIELLFGSSDLKYTNENKNLANDIFFRIDSVLSQMKYLDDYLYVQNKNLMYSDYQKLHIFTSLFTRQYTFEHKVIYSNGNELITSNLVDVFENTIHVNKDKHLHVVSIETNIKDINKKSRMQLISDFKQNVYPEVIFQIATNYWGINRQITDLEKSILDKSLSYFKEMDWKEFNTAISHWLEQQHLDVKYKKRRVQRDIQLVNIIMHHLLKLQNARYDSKVTHDNKLDFDHIIPKSILDEVYDKLPISGALNIWPIYYKDNRSKMTRDIGEICKKPIQEIDRDFYNYIGLNNRTITIASSVKDSPSENFDLYLKARKDDYSSLLLEVSKYISTFRFD